jgi:CHAD domain-containing protein
VAASERTAHLERELKLTAPPDLALDGLADEVPESRVFDSTYHDTPDRRLARAGLTLRRRVENGTSRWQLKLPRAGGRLEIEALGGPAPVPEAILQLLPALLHGRELEPVATLRTRRTSVEVRRGGGVAEVSLDSVVVLDGQRVASAFGELEIELLDGDEAALRRVEKVVRRAGARDGDGRPKLFRVLGLDAERAPGRKAPPLEHLRSLLAAQLREIHAHDPGVRLGDHPEDVHQLRVAARRSRALLRAARTLLDRAWADELGAELRWLGGELGPVRDLDVLLEHLRAEQEQLGPDDRAGGAAVISALAADRQAAHRRAVAALGTPRYLALLDRLDEASREPHASEREGSLRKIAGKEFRRLERIAGALGDDPSDEDVHNARIAAKRARYAGELAQSACGKPARSFVAAAKRFQDVAGTHQDTIVAEEHIRRLRSGDAGALAAGRLVERQRARRAAARRELPSVWRALRRRGRRAWA